jgi:hypothetical protein
MWMTDLFRAFSILVSASPEKIGEGWRWKSKLLTMTIFISVAFPFFNMRFASPYQGDLPPLVPLIRGNGKIAFLQKKQGFRSSDYAAFVGEDGKKYVFQDYSSLLGVEKFVNEHPSQSVHVEGFILKNGEGLFWPTSISTVAGEILLAPEKLSRQLENRRDVWGGLLLIQKISLLPLWIISFFNAVKIARKLKEGENG